MDAGVDHFVPFHMVALPLLSTATQKVVARHDTEVKLYDISTVSGDDHFVPFQERASPPVSTAMQKVDDAHDTAVILASIGAGCDHPGVDAYALTVLAATVANATVAGNPPKIVATTKNCASLRKPCVKSLASKFPGLYSYAKCTMDQVSWAGFPTGYSQGHWRYPWYCQAMEGWYSPWLQNWRKP